MIKLGGTITYRFLRNFFPRKRTTANSRRAGLASYESRLVRAVGEKEWAAWRDKVVVDFGCGHGEGVIELAKSGIRKVVGIDIRPEMLANASQRASDANVSDRCEFTTHGPTQSADVIVSVDAFEHFSDPASVLESMAQMLSPQGYAVASFGPTWYHPRGGHLFSMFPWAHLVFSESSLCRWRLDFRDDGAQRFCEVEGGLNQMTIKHFKHLVDESPLQIKRFSLVPIGAAKKLHNRWTREFLTSVVECILVKEQA